MPGKGPVDRVLAKDSARRLHIAWLTALQQQRHRAATALMRSQQTFARVAATGTLSETGTVLT